MIEKFLTDDQTLQDIQLRDLSHRSIFDFFDQAITEGGQDYFRLFFYAPTLDIEIIKERQSKIHRLEPVAYMEFPFYRVIMKDIEKYVRSSHSGSTSSLGLLDFLGVKSPAYYYKKRSILETCDFLVKSRSLYVKINETHAYEDIENVVLTIDECLLKILKNKGFESDKLKVTIFNIDAYDRMIRYELSSKIKKIISFFYEVDCYIAIAKLAKLHSFCYPEVYPKNHTGKVDMKGLYHIFHKKPVKNNICLNREKKMWFLTGANMAGKSSIIKSIATALYLTHIGLPVPADSIKTDLIDGLFTSINLQDNLDLGYSHFYVEAIRLKTIVDQLHKDSNALIILDELFKGTNQTDASNAIWQIMKLFTDLDGPFVIVSSHITELSQKLQEMESIDFFKMYIDNDQDGIPVFTYKIIPGVAEEKLGMWLLKKSGVFESIQKLR